MQQIFFIVRHIPFWGIPMILIGSEFAYLFWKKKKKKLALFSSFFVFIGTLSTGFYVWAGGPQKSVKIIKKIYIEFYFQSNNPQ